MKTLLSFKKKRALLLLIFLTVISTQHYYSAVGITAPNLTIATCNTFPSSYSSIGNIVITEGANADIPLAAILTNYTITLTAPANFQFNAGVGSVNASSGDITTMSVVVTATTITITYQSNEANRTNENDVITVSGIQVRAITALATQTVTKTASSEAIAGLANATVVANLSSTATCSCTHTLRMTDTFGDGWNGGTVSVSVNGSVVLANVTLASGFGPSDLTFNAATGDLIRVYETAAGSFPTEMLVQVLDGGMTSIIVAHDPVAGTATTGGNTGNGNCPPPMVITSATVVQASSANASRCDANQEIVCLQITTTGASNPITVTQIQTNFSGTAGVGALSGADVFYTGTSNSFSPATLFGSNASPTVATYSINGSQQLMTGTNYFWLAYDLNNTGTIGNTIDGLITQFTAAAVNYNSGSAPAITTTNPAGSRPLVICFTPGGIGSQSLWMRADAGTSTTTNNATVSSWTSQVASPAVIASQGTVALQPTYKDGSGTGTNNRFNYNPFIYTDGTSNRLFQNGDINFGNAATGFSVYQVIGEDNGIVAMDWYHTTNGSIKAKGDALMYINDAAGTSQVNCFNANGSQTVQAFLQSVRGTPNNVSGNGRFNGILGAAYSNGWRVASQNGISIGSNLDNGEFMQGGMGEFIIFPSTLNAANSLKVESYLAIKYGITLGTSASVSNYTSSANTVLWTGLAAYQNNIIGIGRDDVSTLNQKQSHYYNDDFRIYKGVLSPTNQSNASTFALDQSFVISGDNAAAICATAVSNAEIPSPALGSCALSSRLAREWRITRTNMAENFNIDIKLAACAAPGTVTAADLRFLVDDDGNFANGGTQCYYNGDGTGIVISYSNPYITVSNVNIANHIANNVTKFVTIGSINTATPLPVDVVEYQANKNEKKTVDLTWQTLSERDNDYFTIYKSIDAETWTYLGTIDGAGNSNSQINYYMEDQTPLVGENYYKLTQTDFNGQSTEIGIRIVVFENQAEYILYPNPANGICTIISSVNKNYQFKLYNQLGELVSAAQQTSTIDTRLLAEGLYFIQIEDNIGSHNFKLIIKR